MGEARLVKDFAGSGIREVLCHCNRRMIALIVLAGASACSVAQPRPESFSALLKEDGHTWCAYKDPGEFKADAAAVKPTDSVRITYEAGTLAELTYQIEAESGDWIVIDKYTPSKGDILLRRASLLAQENLQIIQEAVIHGGQAGTFRTASVTTLAGKKAVLATVDLPAVPVMTNLMTQPFVQVIVEMRSRAIGKLCK
jgi:hypothetical protein